MSSADQIDILILHTVCRSFGVAAVINIDHRAMDAGVLHGVYQVTSAKAKLAAPGNDGPVGSHRVSGPGYAAIGAGISVGIAVAGGFEAAEESSLNHNIT